MATATLTISKTCLCLTECLCDPAFGACLTHCEIGTAIHTIPLNAPEKAA